jgi:hypothetical protein
MPKFVIILLVAAALAGCTRGGEVGDVDHSCHGNPAQSQDSGCEHHQLP